MTERDKTNAHIALICLIVAASIVAAAVAVGGA